MPEISQQIVTMHELETYTDPEVPQYYTEVFFRQKGKLYYTALQTRFCPDPVPIFDVEHSDVFPVPQTAYQAEWLDGITKYEVPDPLPPNVFLKTPYLMAFDPTGSRSMASRVQPEVRILERIKADKGQRHDNAGENIGEYYGCSQSSDGLFIAGICLKRYPRTLMDIVFSKNRQFADPDKSKELPSTDPTKVAEYTLPSKPEKVIEGVIKGLQYLHGLDLIHSDINPVNIMFDEEGRSIIIDFDTCVRKGDKVVGGTCGWIDGPDLSTTASEDIDIKAVYRVVIFVHENFTLDDLELPPDYDGAGDNFALIKNWLARKVACVKPWLVKEGKNKVNPSPLSGEI